MIKETGNINLGTADHPVLIPIYEATGEDLVKQNKFISDMCACIDVMRSIHPKSNEFVSDSMECPKCKGKFNYTISDHVNGHISGRCEKCGFGWTQ